MLKNIKKVYSGKIGCMCGCLGKYLYPTQSKNSVRNTKVLALAEEIIKNPSVEHHKEYSVVKTNLSIQVVYYNDEGNPHFNKEVVRRSVSAVFVDPNSYKIIAWHGPEVEIAGELYRSEFTGYPKDTQYASSLLEFDVTGLAVTVLEAQHGTIVKSATGGIGVSVAYYGILKSESYTRWG